MKAHSGAQMYFWMSITSCINWNVRSITKSGLLLSSQWHTHSAFKQASDIYTIFGSSPVNKKMRKDLSGQLNVVSQFRLNCSFSCSITLRCEVPELLQNYGVVKGSDHKLPQVDIIADGVEGHFVALHIPWSVVPGHPEAGSGGFRCLQVSWCFPWWHWKG